MHDLSLHLLDIVQNSVRASAKRINVCIEADSAADRLRLEIVDDGQGMTSDLLSRVTDPFVTTRTTRSVGLGLPLLKELCEMTGGSLMLESDYGKGTRLVADFGLSSIDRPPLGNLADTWMVLLAGNPEIDFILSLRAGEHNVCLNTEELKAGLEGVPLTEPAVLAWIKGYVAEMQQEIFGGVMHEIIS